jgi:hypothetical protein
MYLKIYIFTLYIIFFINILVFFLSLKKIKFNINKKQLKIFNLVFKLGYL